MRARHEHRVGEVARVGKLARNTELLVVGYQFLNNGLAVLSDTDGSALRIDLAFVAGAISLDFGNDLPSLAPGSQAVLKLFLGGVQVDQVTMAMNRNGLVDQTMSYLGPGFDAAEFHYDVPALQGFTTQGFTELVDNVVVTSIPEPSAAILFAVGALVTRRACRRPKRTATTSLPD